MASSIATSILNISLGTTGIPLGSGLTRSLEELMEDLQEKLVEVLEEEFVE